MATLGNNRRRVMARRLACLALIVICGLGAVQLALGAIIPVKAVAAQWLLEQAFEAGLADHRAHKPWPWADMAPVARLAVPRLGAQRIVLDTGSGQAMAFGPALVAGELGPGTAGTRVIAAHRDTHFRFLEQVRVGDIVSLRDIDDNNHRYRVTGTQVVRWDEFAVARGGHRLALATCYPFGAATSGPLRYVVHAVRVGPGTAAEA